jgi:heme/copper-type cytochrome/quinol oxidase subunit 4
MIDGLFIGLILAIFLTLFDFNNVVVKAFKELFNKEITTSSYYFIFALIGTVVGLISGL